MKYFAFFIPVLLGLLCCEKEDELIDVPREKENNLPGSFEITVLSISDNEISIAWSEAIDPDYDKVIYEVAINDSICAYDLSNREYIFKNLNADTEYSLQVIALDSLRSQSIATIRSKTLKSFVRSVLSFDLGYDIVYFDAAKATSDSGLIIAGLCTRSKFYSDCELMITKLDKEFNVEWVKGFNICTEVKGVSELSDHGYLIVLSKKILRIDSSGNEIWTYAPADESLEFTCKSVVETQDNGIIVTGASWRNWRDNNISVEYVITKLSSSGNEVWQKYGGTTLKNIPFDIVQITNGNFLIFGKAESSGKTFDQLQDIIESFWLLETDNQGNFISQNIYPNNSNGEDLPVKIYKTPEENYFLTGTAVVDMYYVTNVPRILKVNDQGAEIWENTYNIKSAGGEFPHLVDMVLKDDSFIMLTYDDRGACLSEINFNGEMIWYIKLDGYPMGLMIGTQENGNYYILTRDGHIVVFNYDGYVVKYY